MMPVPLLRVGTIDPIQNVQGTVGPHEEDVVSGQVFDFSVTLQNNQLGKDCNRLQVNGERPQQLQQSKFGDTRSDQMGEERQNSARSGSKLPMQETILGFVVGALDGFLEFDCVNDQSRRADVDQLHHRVVQRIKMGEQIQVTSHEDQEKEFVGSNRNSCMPQHTQTHTRQSETNAV